MFNNPEQFASATKTLFDLQMQTFNALASKAVQGVEQVVALNLATAKQSMENTLEAGRQFSQAQDPQATIEPEDAKIEMRGGFPVIVGGRPREKGEIVRAIKAGREERDERLASTRSRRRK